MKGDIIGGLKIALYRGEKLQDIMQSFYNAGYKKEDIKEAARALKSEGFQPQTIKRPQLEIRPVKKPVHPSYQPEPKATYTPTISPKIPSIAPRQIVSNYAQPKEKKSIDVVTIILVLVLLLLLGVLIAVFFFKQELVEFLNKFLE